MKMEKVKFRNCNEHMEGVEIRITLKYLDTTSRLRAWALSVQSVGVIIYKNTLNDPDFDVFNSFN